MPGMRILLDGEGAFPDLATKDPADVYAVEASPETATITFLPAGMLSGKASVAIRINLPDGKVVLLQNSLANLRDAVDIIAVAAGQPRPS